IHIWVHVCVDSVFERREHAYRGGTEAISAGLVDPRTYPDVLLDDVCQRRQLRALEVLTEGRRKTVGGCEGLVVRRIDPRLEMRAHCTATRFVQTANDRSRDRARGDRVIDDVRRLDAGEIETRVQKR